MKISVLFIARNEEQLIGKALESVKEADEIIVVDSGSSDRTKDIAWKYTKHIFDFSWCDDFSAARNAAISKATGDWILFLDCDHQLLTNMRVVREEAERAEASGKVVGLVKSSCHYRDCFFKNGIGIQYVGRVHECLNRCSDFTTVIEEKVGYSPTHATDPDRNLRILLKSENSPRTKFYLGREYFERREWGSAVRYMEDYLPGSAWLAEKAEAYYVLAVCHWNMSQGDAARGYCMKAIEINANFKKALKLLAQMSWPRNALRWHQMSELADDGDVLFR